MKKLSLFLLVFLVYPLSGQSAHRLGQIIVKGNGITANVGPYGSVKVCTTGNNCSIPATIYSDEALTHVMQQPVIADGNGNYSYFIVPACVDEQISSPGQGILNITFVCPSTGAVGTGSVNRVSVDTANGFQGTVGNPTTLPDIAISTDSSHYLPTTTDQTNWNSKQAGLGFTPENVANKDVASGYAGLNASALLETMEIPAFTGDVTSLAGTTALTLATVNSGSGACGDATHICSITTNPKGLVTAQTATPIAAVTSVSAGNLAPLFTASVATSATTPAISFTQSPAPNNSVLAGASSGSAVAPTFQTAPAISAANMTNFPEATASVFGVVKPDNSTITISGGVISATGGGGGPTPAFSTTGSAIPLSGTEAVAFVPIGTGSSTALLRQLTQDDILPGFSINSFAGGSTVEIGATVTNPAFTASYSATPASAQITNTDGINSPFTLTTPFTAATITGSFVHTTATSTTFTLTAVSSSTRTATQAIQWEPRTFGGVGTAGATGATVSGTSAILVGATGTLANAGLNNQATYGPFSPAGQKVYLLMIGGSHTFKDAVTGFAFVFNTPTAVSFVNQNGATVSMFLYESTNTLSGTLSIQVVS